MAEDRAPETWIVVEHDPVVTLGRNADGSQVLVSAHALAARGIDLVTVDRGGDATYHGPGQVVVYPIRKLPRFREVAPLVTLLESAVADALAGFGIRAGGRREHRGVYVGDAAICAVGLAVRRMTTMHGIALNAATALDYDRLITPCGTPQFGITSISREVGRTVGWSEARDALLPALARAFGLQFAPGVPPATALPVAASQG